MCSALMTENGVRTTQAAVDVFVKKFHDLLRENLAVGTFYTQIGNWKIETCAELVMAMGCSHGLMVSSTVTEEISYCISG